MFICMACSGTQKAQVSDSREGNYLEQAARFYRSGDTAQAKVHWEQALRQDSADHQALKGLAQLAVDRANFDRAQSILKKAEKYHPNGGDLLMHYQMGICAWELSDYPVAFEKMGKYLAFEDNNTARQALAEKVQRDSRYCMSSGKDPEALVVKLGKAINTDAPEYLPSLPVHEEFMVFTRRVRGQEDLYISQAQQNEWTSAMALSELNSADNEGAHSISADGNTIAFTRCRSRDGLGSCDLVYAVYNNRRWSEPQNFGPPVNSKSWDAQPCFGPDMRRLYFSSERPGGVGKRDVWFVDRTVDGWSVPQNLVAVNTPENDESPFIHADGHTLYFMSNGHPGHGGYDLFSTDLDDPTSKIINLGAGINTKRDEGALHAMRDGEMAFFSRTEKGPNGLVSDIYRTNLPSAVQADAVAYLDVKVFDKATGERLDAVLRITDTTDQDRKQFVIYAQRRNIFPLPISTTYSLQIDREGFDFYSERLRLTDDKKAEPTGLNISLTKLSSVVEHTPVVLKNILFASGSAELLSASHAELGILHDKLVSAPGLKIEIRGHTDDVGSDEDNLILSEQRARAVRDYLMSLGKVDDGRLQYRGYGESVPIANNDTPEGRAINRRTEFMILDNE